MDHKTAIKTKANRARSIKAIGAAIEATGATFTTEAAYYNPDKEIRWRAKVGPYSVHGELCAGSNVGAFGAHWCTDTYHPATFPRAFGCRHGVSVNQFHYGKATAFYDTLEQLCESVAACLAEIAEHWSCFSEAERFAMDSIAETKKARTRAAFAQVAA